MEQIKKRKNTEAADVEQDAQENVEEEQKRKSQEEAEPPKNRISLDVEEQIRNQVCPEVLLYTEEQ